MTSRRFIFYGFSLCSSRPCAVLETIKNQSSGPFYWHLIRSRSNLDISKLQPLYNAYTQSSVRWCGLKFERAKLVRVPVQRCGITSISSHTRHVLQRWHTAIQTLEELPAALSPSPDRTDYSIHRTILSDTLPAWRALRVFQQFSQDAREACAAHISPQHPIPSAKRPLNKTTTIHHEFAQHPANRTPTTSHEPAVTWVQWSRS